jgi:hypothetical protein
MTDRTSTRKQPTNWWTLAVLLCGLAGCFKDISGPAHPAPDIPQESSPAPGVDTNPARPQNERPGAP